MLQAHLAEHLQRRKVGGDVKRTSQAEARQQLQALMQSLAKLEQEREKTKAHHDAKVRVPAAHRRPYPCMPIACLFLVELTLGWAGFQFARLWAEQEALQASVKEETESFAKLRKRTALGCVRYVATRPRHPTRPLVFFCCVS
jgi:hypothetical protein